MLFRIRKTALRHVPISCYLIMKSSKPTTDRKVYRKITRKLRENVSEILKTELLNFNCNFIFKGFYLILVLFVNDEQANELVDKLTILKD